MGKRIKTIAFFVLFVLSAALTMQCTVSKAAELSESAGNATGVLKRETTVANEVDIPLPLRNVPEQILYRKGYVVSYNKDTKVPNWVAWHLTANHVEGDVKRPANAWHEDMSVPFPRAMHSDYRRSGWTHGHMCPVGDNKWDREAMYESFLMTNCCPQVSSLNNGDWNEIEIACRRWAKRFGDVYIVCGPIFLRQNHLTIGANRVMVPEAFFKVVMCLNGKPKGIGYICRNIEGNQKKKFYQHSIREVERVTGMTFFPHLSPDIAAKVKNSANEDEWEK